MWTSMIPFSKMLEKDHGEILSRKKAASYYSTAARRGGLHLHRSQQEGRTQFPMRPETASSVLLGVPQQLGRQPILWLSLHHSLGWPQFNGVLQI